MSKYSISRLNHPGQHFIKQKYWGGRGVLHVDIAVTYLL